ncbi:uncharacterized protein [Triticum aestivum]|uniref:uncharacterized protein isoform X2 n=1 Tax=Triticum aestivum TaxID=4565 RepID=UPI001D003F45|nr:uncharacterized protein LOC123133378 isoform X2 [Triticum aestivum]
MPSSSSNSMQGRGRGGVLLPPRASSLSERHPTSSERKVFENLKVLFLIDRCMCGWQQINLLLNPCQASSVDDDDNQGIHRHDDTPHMVQLGYNLLYRATAAAVVFGIDYNLLFGPLVHYTDCMPPLSSPPRLPHHRHHPSAFSFDAVVDS